MTGATCPVCGFDDLELPMTDGDICCRCGYEMGFDDDGATHKELRARWEAAGRPWFSTYRHPPMPDLDEQTRADRWG